MRLDLHQKYILLLVVIVNCIFYSGCRVSHIGRQTNGDFSSGSEGWQVEPIESVSIVGEGKILAVELSSE